jgi:hypothetical protein
MEIDYEKLMAGKSDEGLTIYLEKVEIYTEEAVVAAMRELQERGRRFSEQELGDLKLKLEEKKNAKVTTDKKLNSNPWTKNVVTQGRRLIILSGQFGCSRQYSQQYSARHYFLQTLKTKGT